jgi:hypothetical protein
MWCLDIYMSTYLYDIWLLVSCLPICLLTWNMSAQLYDVCPPVWYLPVWHLLICVTSAFLYNVCGGGEFLSVVILTACFLVLPACILPVLPACIHPVLPATSLHNLCCFILTSGICTVVQIYLPSIIPVSPVNTKIGFICLAPSQNICKPCLLHVGLLGARNSAVTIHKFPVDRLFPAPCTPLWLIWGETYRC